jgi:hypothetical protein
MAIEGLVHEGWRSWLYNKLQQFAPTNAFDVSTNSNTSGKRSRQDFEAVKIETEAVYIAPPGLQTPRDGPSTPPAEDGSDAGLPAQVVQRIAWD